MFRNVLFFALLLIAGWFALRWSRKPKTLFEIRVSEKDVTVLGLIPNKSQGDLREYVRDLRLPIGARVIGVEDGPDFHLRFSKTIRGDDRDRLEGFIRGG